MKFIFAVIYCVAMCAAFVSDSRALHRFFYTATGIVAVIIALS